MRKQLVQVTRVAADASSAMRPTTPRAMGVLACCAALGLGVVGCSKTTAPEQDAGTQAPERGLDAPGNLPSVVTLAKDALECPWSDPVSEAEHATCAAFERWTRAAEVLDGAAEPTLLAMLDDERPHVRWLAGVALQASPRTLHRDGARAKILVDAARRERSSRAGSPLGSAVGALELDATGLEREVQDLLEHHTLASLRAGAVGRTLESNPRMFDLVARIARSEPDEEVRRSALWGLRHAPEARRDEASALWLEIATGTSSLADRLAEYCAASAPMCEAHWTALLTGMEARSARATYTYVFALGALHAQPKASAAQKARATELALAVLGNETVDEFTRSCALDLVAKTSPDEARKLAESYARAPSVFLQASAQSILSGASRGE